MSLRGSPIRRLQLFSKQTSSQTLALTAQVQRLNSLIHTKNLQIKQLYDENKFQKLKYQQQISIHMSTIKTLQNKLKTIQVQRSAQFEIIKQKYDRLALEQSQNMKSYHSHQIQFLLKEIAHLRVDCTTKDQKLMIKQNQVVSLTQSYEREIQQKINEINNLNKNLLNIQDTKNREIKQISSKRQLQKSRTSGVLSSRKENNQFMDRQIRKLNEQILEKAIKIQNLTREMNKMKRRFQDAQKMLNKKIQDLIVEKQEESKQRQEHFAKIQKGLKQQILQFKSNQMKYLGQIDSLKNYIQSLNAQLKRSQSNVKSRQEQINGYKQILNKQRQDHSRQIANLMKQRKRKSSNLGSSRSLSSSLRDAGGNSEDHVSNSQGIGLKKLDSVRLATVKQESPDKSLSHSMQNSHLTQQLGEEDNQLVKLVYHYDTLIQQLKRSHAAQAQLLKHKLNKLTKALDEKQQQILDILTRFSPLVKIHAQEKSVEQDRKQRIQRHWKADLALLDIMLKKYKIKAYQ